MRPSAQLTRFQLSKEDEATIGSSEDTEVRREDQEKINRFSRLHQRETVLNENLKGKQVLIYPRSFCLWHFYLIDSFLFPSSPSPAIPPVMSDSVRGRRMKQANNRLSHLHRKIKRI